MNKKAVDYYMGAERYNCAQAVLKGFQKHFSVSEATVASFKNKGAGKASDGMCGSAYAAISLLTNEIEQELFRASFNSSVGSIKCKEIRKMKQCSCRDTVVISEKILNEIIN